MIYITWLIKERQRLFITGLQLPWELSSMPCLIAAVVSTNCNALPYSREIQIIYPSCPEAHCLF